MAKWRKNKEDNYFSAMLKHQTNVNAFLGTAALGAFLSIPFGVGLGLLPLVGYAAGVSLASLVLPGYRPFQKSVDRQRHIRSREAARAHVMSEIQRRVGAEHPYWATYSRLLDRCQALRRVADEQDTALTGEDVDALEDTTVDFLGLWLGRIAIHERHESMSASDLAERIAQVDAELEQVTVDHDRRRLIKAKNDLTALLRSREEMVSRDMAAEAAMLSMADAFDEVYQRVMADPNSQEQVSSGVKAAVERMNIEEELDYILEEEVDALLYEGG